MTGSPKRTHFSLDRVPEATQLLAMPFLAAVAGLIALYSRDAGYRVTLHRTISRDGRIYLQQVTNYLSSDAEAVDGSGRSFAVDHGIIGAAFADRKLHRTASFAGMNELEAALLEDAKTNSDADIAKIARSYFALPFLDRTGLEDIDKHSPVENRAPIMILYAECFKENIFAIDELARELTAACTKFAETLDLVTDSATENIRNFPFTIEGSAPVFDGETVYKRLNGKADFGISPPSLTRMRSFNFEFVA